MNKWLDKGKKTNYLELKSNNQPSLKAEEPKKLDEKKADSKKSEKEKPNTEKSMKL